MDEARKTLRGVVEEPEKFVDLERLVVAAVTAGTCEMVEEEYAGFL